MHRFSHILRLMVAASLTGLVASCTSSPRAPATGAAGTATGRLVTAIPDDVKSLDPALAFDTWSTAIVHAATRRLVDYDESGRLVPDVAERWEASSDGTTWTFHLRSAQYADGGSVTADHFAAAVRRVQDEKTGSPGAGFYRAIKSLSAPDDRTLVVRLSEPLPTLPNVLGLTFAAPLRPGTAAGRPSPSGPYVIQDATSSQVVLRKNAADTAAADWVDEIVVQLKVNDSLRATRFKNGEVDLLPSIPAADYARVMADPSSSRFVVSSPVSQTWYFGMKLDVAPWDDIRVRRAAMLAIDRGPHARLSGGGVVAESILPPHVPGYRADRRLPVRDLAGARKLIAEVVAEKGPLRLVEFWINTTSDYSRHAQAIQANLKEAGIEVALRPVSSAQYLSGYRKEAPCWYGGWYPDFPDAGNFLEPLFHSSGLGKASNATHFADPKVNAVLDRARKTARGEARYALYAEAESLILERVPWVPLYFEVETRWFREGVTGVRVDPVWRQILTGIRRR